ncbi:MAG: type I restriction endonuclease subunit R [Prevotellaceae bacterium]|nr:type I restriction endonuclease subunit R [Prevotellaceae bacterium]
MAEVDDIELKAQQRLLHLMSKDFDSKEGFAADSFPFADAEGHMNLGYLYLGNLKRQENTNLKQDLLRSWLSRQGHTTYEIDHTVNILSIASRLSQASQLYDKNEEFYSYLRYGVASKEDISDKTHNIQVIDWENPLNNDFYVAQEVTVKRLGKETTIRPDIVVYVNGIALATVELKRSKVSVHEGIRQQIRNQEDGYIPQFFNTVQLLLAGNDSEGLWYGVIGTPEKFWLRWKEPCGDPCPKSKYTPELYPNELDRSIMQFFDKERFLEFIHDFLIFDGGIKKAARPNQYFAIKAAQKSIGNHEGGIIWQSQGSGKSLIMVWLAKWIHENLEDPRVIIVTDRNELDDQIEQGFADVKEDISRATSGAQLIRLLNSDKKWLICTLIHKFGARKRIPAEYIGNKRIPDDEKAYMEILQQKLPEDFSVKGKNVIVFVDECHRTQSGLLHKAMEHIMGKNFMMIGFTGTPILRSDKRTSMELFGSFIHTYKFDEAVDDKVILDLRYEPRNVKQYLGSKDKVDQWFDAKTKGLSRVAKKVLMGKWAQMKKLFSAKERMDRIVTDIVMDMDTKPALAGGYGNAMLVADSIYQACRYYKMFEKTSLKGHVGLVTSYEPQSKDVKDEYTGEGETGKKFIYDTYEEILGKDLKAADYEAKVKKEFVDHPGRIKLVIVVSKLLTGFDAPAATYLYLDKKMQDQNLFQAICRVNRVAGENKDYGFIIDYQDLFNAIRDAVDDYTSGAFDAFDKADVEGLVKDRVKQGREDLDKALETVRKICEDVEPKTQEGFFAFFVYKETTPPDEQWAESEKNATKRQLLYKAIEDLVRAYINIANDMEAAGYTATEAAEMKKTVAHYNDLKDEIKLKSADAIDLKAYTPGMRQLLDNYVRAEDSELVADMSDVSFLDVILDKGAEEGAKHMPKTMKDPKNMAEYITGNTRRIIIEKHQENPAYYDRMSEMLNNLLEQLKKEQIDYKQLIEQLVEKLREEKLKLKKYPPAINTAGKKALYDNLDKDMDVTLQVDAAVRRVAKAKWRGSRMKERAIKIAVGQLLGKENEALIEKVFNIIKAQKEY